MISIAGFARRPVSEGELWVAEEFEQAAAALGLDRLSGWSKPLEEGLRAGRGTVAFVEGPQGPVVLKQLRRGGIAGPLWRERFPSRRRLLDNLALPALARGRGVATPAAVALLLVPAGPGLWRGWLAVRAVPGGESLAERMTDRPPSDEEWAAALGLVRRLHDAGFRHPDLNLGNLLVDVAGAFWVIDLDGCRVDPAGLGADARIDGIRRIERSYHKLCFLGGMEPDSRLDWLAFYAAGDRSLDARWEQRRDRDAARLRRHRRGWRRPGL